MTAVPKPIARPISIAFDSMLAEKQQTHLATVEFKTFVAIHLLGREDTRNYLDHKNDILRNAGNDNDPSAMYILATTSSCLG